MGSGARGDPILSTPGPRPADGLTARRIVRHPVLAAPPAPGLVITWRGEPIPAREGETLAAALAAAGVRVLGHHARDGAPQGLFCANGQCAQCLVIAGGRPVKACVTRVAPGLAVEPADGLPVLPPARPVGPFVDAPVTHARVLVLGGGPAGLTAARELGARGVDVLLVDDKPALGGKLVLQTHRFFGSAAAVHAGTRGVDLAALLDREARATPNVRVWTSSTALALFGDGRVGVLRDADGDPDEARYALVAPEAVLVATGARERFLAFPGNTLPGVIGAGAFQTLVNRDRVRVAARVLVVGGGNVGLITAWHALQAGVEVAAVVEALPRCGGYRVHHDKLARAGVPILTSHTILAAHGDDRVTAATIAAVDAAFRPVPGSERTIACDAVLLAVGLEPARELYEKARAIGLPAAVAGDADEVAEASAAVFAGRIRALELARRIGLAADEVPDDWRRAMEVLRSRPGPTHPPAPAPEEGVAPVFHCTEEIPCDPCASVCPTAAIAVDPADLRHLPTFLGAARGAACVGCEKCVAVCPGLAITLVDWRGDPDRPTVVVPFELDRAALREGGRVTAVDVDGRVLGEAEVVRVRGGVANDRTLAVKLRVPRAIAARVAGLRGPVPPAAAPPVEAPIPAAGEAMICRCERVTIDRVRALVRAGVHDPAEIKARTRVGMGACGAHGCGPLLRRLLRDEGVPDAEVVEPTPRPLLVEVPLGVLAGAGGRRA